MPSWEKSKAATSLQDSSFSDGYLSAAMQAVFDPSTSDSSSETSPTQTPCSDMARQFQAQEELLDMWFGPAAASPRPENTGITPNTPREQFVSTEVPKPVGATARG